jgi:ABC-type transport system substrate-binding protein
LIGEPRDVNVWELFDESGASYEDYALRSEYWPRLYHLAPPEFAFQPLAADGLPSPVIQDGEFYSATVKLRQDLKWTDGSPFTAGDVAFTVDTALAFELGFDWMAYYSGNHLSHLEVVDAFTVKFVFRQKPGVAAWQYGALQGPVVQKAYWEPLTQETAGLLPDAASRAQVEAARAYLTKIQANVDNLTAQVNALRLAGQTNRKLEASLTGGQNELIFAQNSLDKLLEDTNVKMQSAREALYALDDTGEPTLGTWIPAGRQDGAWVNEANPQFPFVRPNFDRAVYSVYIDLESAISAFEKNEVDVILGPNGVPDQNRAWANPTNSGRFLVFNPRRAVLADPAVRRAMSCMIRRSAMTSGQEEPYDGFILDGPWRNKELSFLCSGLSDELAIQNSVSILKEAGYSWAQEPTAARPGSGLILPDGTPFPPVVLTITSPEYEFRRVHAAEYIQLQFQYLGIPSTVEFTDPEGLRYAVYSSGEYDLAILGWGLGLYPGYLCDWFGAGGQFDYGREGLKSECEALAVDSDLESARRRVFEIQSILMEDLPFLPLYTKFTYDAYRNVQYPFESVLGGLGGLYGAPSHAIPVR